MGNKLRGQYEKVYLPGTPSGFKNKDEQDDFQTRLDDVLEREKGNDESEKQLMTFGSPILSRAEMGTP